jgi:hypothetical protein
MKRWTICLLSCWFLVGQARAEVMGANDQPIHDAARIGGGNEISTLLKATTRCPRCAHGSGFDSLASGGN